MRIQSKRLLRAKYRRSCWPWWGLWTLCVWSIFIRVYWTRHWRDDKNTIIGIFWGEQRRKSLFTVQGYGNDGTQEEEGLEADLKTWAILWQIKLRQDRIMVEEGKAKDVLENGKQMNGWIACWEYSICPERILGGELEILLLSSLDGSLYSTSPDPCLCIFYTPDCGVVRKIFSLRGTAISASVRLSLGHSF